MNTRAEVEAINEAATDEPYKVLVNDLRLAVCRADSDPSLPHQKRLEIPDDGPSIEECQQRLRARLAEPSSI